MKASEVCRADEWAAEVEAMASPGLRQEDGWITPQEFAGRAGIARSSAKDFLQRGVREGRFESKRGTYRQESDGRTFTRTAYRKLK